MNANKTNSGVRQHPITREELNELRNTFEQVLQEDGLRSAGKKLGLLLFDFGAEGKEVTDEDLRTDERSPYFSESQPETFQKKVENVVRRLEQAAKTLNATPPSGISMRIERKPRKMSFSRLDRPSDAGCATSTDGSEFWGPHVENPPVIAYTEAFFIRNAELPFFLRDLSVNTPEEAKQAELHKLLPGEIEKRLFVWAYVPTGEVQSTLHLVNWLHGRGVGSLQIATSKSRHYNDVFQEHGGRSLIAIGAGRANGIVSSLQESSSGRRLSMVVEHDRIRLRYVTKEERAQLLKGAEVRGVPITEDAGDLLFSEHLRDADVIGYAVLTRFWMNGKCVTMLHGNHSKVID